MIIVRNRLFGVIRHIIIFLFLLVTFAQNYFKTIDLINYTFHKLRHIFCQESQYLYIQHVVSFSSIFVGVQISLTKPHLLNVKHNPNPNPKPICHSFTAFIYRVLNVKNSEMLHGVIMGLTTTCLNINKIIVIQIKKHTQYMFIPNT